MKKYELLQDDFIIKNGKKLYRIRAIRDFGIVKAGAMGGYIESEKNLSHDGNCWVADHGLVYEKGQVFGDGQVAGNGWVCGNGRVSGHGWVFGNGKVAGHGRVFGTGWVAGDGIVAKYDLDSGNCRA